MTILEIHPIVIPITFFIGYATHSIMKRIENKKLYSQIEEVNIQEISNDNVYVSISYFSGKVRYVALEYTYYNATKVILLESGIDLPRTEQKLIKIAIYNVHNKK